MGVELVDSLLRTLGPRSPWRLWLAVCLCRQRARQTWLVEVEERLAGDDGDVPGELGWRAHHHGLGLCLAGPQGEIVDMDFAEDSPRSIDPYFFAHRVTSTRRGPESELRRWMPTQDLVVAALATLRRDGLIEHPTSEHVFRLEATLERVHSEIAQLDDAALTRACRSALSRADNTDAPGGPAHVAWLGSLLEQRSRSAVVQGIAALVSDAVLHDLARRHIGAPDSMSAALLDVCTARDLDASAEASRMAAHLDPSAHHPFVACAVARQLLARSGSRDARALDLVRRFAAVERVAGYLGNPMLDELAFLLLEHAPEEAIPVVRRALRGSPFCAEQLSMLLAAIDEPWCHRELESLLRDAGAEPALRRRATRALAASSSELARRRARQLAPAPPQPDGRPGFSYDEVDHARLEHEPFEIPARMRALAERLRGRVL